MMELSAFKASHGALTLMAWHDKYALTSVACTNRKESLETVVTYFTVSLEMSTMGHVQHY